MRIIAGTFRGRQLSTVEDRSVRPTTGRAKQVIFDILANRIAFDGIAVLDLFAGSGSLGLEAISRGAGHVTFVERAALSIAVLEANIRRLHCEEQATIQQADVFWFLKNTRRSYDLIFADPPFALKQIGDLPSALAESDVTKPGTVVVMEHGRASAVSVPEPAFDVLRKHLGQTVVLILTARTPASDGKEGIAE